MKAEATSTRLIFALILVLGLLLLAPPIRAEKGHVEEHQHSHDDVTKDKKARCAIDGMMMKASVMTKVTHGEKTHYFCNAKQAEMFKAHPDKHLKQISLGHLMFNLNLLTLDEYKEMVADMGMGNMMKMDAMKGKTHRIGVYLTQHRRDIALDGISLALQKLLLIGISCNARSYWSLWT